MFEKDSIKFKLILVISLIICLLLFLLFTLQTRNALTLESEIEKSSIQALDHYSEQEQDVFRRHYIQGIDQYIQMMALTVAQELYDLNRMSLDDKTLTFLRHDAVCSVSIIESLTGVPISQAAKPLAVNCISRSVAILYKNEEIGRLDVTYTLAPIDAMRSARAREMDQIRKALQHDITSITRQSIIVQSIIYAVTVFVMLLLVARQINRGIIQPVYSLLADMQLLTSGGHDELQGITRSHPNSELGRLTSYFHDHIAKLITKLNQMANYDSLTMLFSRQRLLVDIKHLEHFNLAVLDIDRFREINNFLGMDAGDDLLRATADSLRRHFSRHDYSIYRMNSDEFAVIDDRAAPLALFESHISEFLQRFEEEDLRVEGQMIAASITAGICSQGHPSPIVAATTALNHAKSAQLKVAIYHDQLPVLEQYQSNLRTSRLIRTAIAEDLVVPHYQPIQDIATGIISKYEVLMRIGDPEGRIHRPADFLAVAKRSGTYKRLSSLTIAKAIAEASANGHSLSINLSIEDIERNDILATLLDLHDRYGMMNRTIFEITEQEGFSNLDTIKSFIREAKQLGALFAIDDFGSGYSNFEALIHLDFDFIKIDGSLVRCIASDRNSQIVVETIIDFADRLGIKTIAEFVADQPTYDKVKSMGIHFAQGYYIGVPAPGFGSGVD